MKNRRLEEQLGWLVANMPAAAIGAGDIDSCQLLCELGTCSKWGEDELRQVDFISKRVDISRKLYRGYLANGRKASEEVVSDNHCLELLIAILFRAVLEDQSNDPALLLKRFNVLFKALDRSCPDWLAPGSELGELLEELWASALPRGGERNVAVTPLPEREGFGDEKTIPLTVLFYEGPIARAYLTTISDLGLKPQKIIDLVSSRDVATKKPVGRWLPGGLRSAYAATIQRNKIHYWPKQLQKAHAGLFDSIVSGVESRFGFGRSLIDSANALLPLSSYSECVETLLVDGLSDQSLLQQMEGEPSSTILFTGGGIVPVSLLGLSHLRFLHVHPGFLPDIRGADCTLWSSLLAGHTSATCFYMSPGIDAGDIIKSCWLPKLSLESSPVDADLQSLYRAIYAFVDPWVRAFVLREMLLQYDSYSDIDSTPQDEASGTTFHFMHSRLREAAFSKFFKS